MYPIVSKVDPRGTRAEHEPHYQRQPASGRDHVSGNLSERKRRQSDLLDEALMATFPASDPVSVAFVR